MAFQLRTHAGYCNHDCDYIYARAASAVGASTCPRCGDTWDHWGDKMSSTLRLGLACARRT